MVGVGGDRKRERESFFTLFAHVLFVFDLVPIYYFGLFFFGGGPCV
jgi:hypothetical protein